MVDDQEFLESLRDEFIDTLEDEFQDCQELLFQFEKEFSEANMDLLLRKVHSLKGSAHSVEWEEIAQEIHNLETEMLKMKSTRGPELVNLVSGLLAHIDQITTTSKQGKAA